MSVQSRPRLLGATLVVGALVAGALAGAARPTNAAAATHVAKKEADRALAGYGRLPLAFEPNLGQAPAQVNYMSRGAGFGVYLRPTTALLTVHARTPGRGPATATRSAAVAMDLLGGNPAASGQALGKLPGKANYLIGKNPANWKTDLATFRRVRFAEVYRGIAVDYYGNGSSLEYDFRVAPGADPSRIRLSMRGARDVRLDSRGNLDIVVPGGLIRQQAPISYQDVNGTRRAVASKFALAKNGEVSFRLGKYDRSRPLIIDPSLVFGTYLGGTGKDEGLGIAVDETGNSYITGYTASTDFRKTRDAFDTNANGGTNAFISKLNNQGSALIYSTYLGGDGDDMGTGIQVFRNPADGLVYAVISGCTLSTDFPTTAKNAYISDDPDLELNPDGSVKTNHWDAFVTEINSNGSFLIYSSYYGGDLDDCAYGVSLTDGTSFSANGSGFPIRVAAIAGQTFSTDLPTTVGTFDSTLNSDTGDAFAAAFALWEVRDASFLSGTYFGGGRVDIANGVFLDSVGRIYLVGSTRSTDLPISAGALQPEGDEAGTAFVARIDGVGGTLALGYSTYLGSPHDGLIEEGLGIDVDGSGEAYVVGATNSVLFPTTAGAYQQDLKLDFTSNPLGNPTIDAFFSRLNFTGTTLVYSTLLGGTASDVARSVAIDAIGVAHITGDTQSNNFPSKFSLFRPRANAGQALSDVFVVHIDPTLTGTDGLRFGTFLGSPGHEVGRSIAVDECGNDYVTGYVGFAQFAVTNGSLDASYNGKGDAFITKITQMAIYNLDISLQTPETARVFWDTPCPADSVVEFGLDEDYGGTVRSSALVTSHDVMLTGLAPSTEYHYRVKSMTADGTIVVSPDRTFFTVGDGSPVVKVTVESLYRRSTDEIHVRLTFFNAGPGAASGEITRARLKALNKTARTRTTLPLFFGTLGEGASNTVRIRFPGSIGNSGIKARLLLEGNFAGKEFGKVLRFRLP